MLKSPKIRDSLQQFLSKKQQPEENKKEQTKENYVSVSNHEGMTLYNLYPYYNGSHYKIENVINNTPVTMTVIEAEMRANAGNQIPIQVLVGIKGPDGRERKIDYKTIPEIWYCHVFVNKN